MSQELHYTSAPRGLTPGTRGFCTVARTADLSKVLAERLESLSGYRQVFPPHHPSETLNPVVYSHLRLANSDQSVLSRIGFAGLDYSDRANKYAHHVIISAGERPRGGPAWLASQPGFLDSHWQGEPRILLTGRVPARGDQAPGICKQWQVLAGDSGWAGALAQAFLEHPERPAYLVFRPGMNLLQLFAEALALLPPERRWQVTFSTYFTGLQPGLSCAWRGVLCDTPEAEQATRTPGALVIDLTQPSGSAPDTSLAHLARTGEYRPEFEVENSSWDTTEFPELEETDSLPIPYLQGSPPPIAGKNFSGAPQLRSLRPPRLPGQRVSWDGGRTPSGTRKIVAAAMVLFLALGLSTGLTLWSLNSSLKSVTEQVAEVIEGPSVIPKRENAKIQRITSEEVDGSSLGHWFAKFQLSFNTVLVEPEPLYNLFSMYTFHFGPVNEDLDRKPKLLSDILNQDTLHFKPIKIVTVHWVAESPIHSNFNKKFKLIEGFNNIKEVRLRVLEPLEKLKLISSQELFVGGPNIQEGQLMGKEKSISESPFPIGRFFVEGKTLYFEYKFEVKNEKLNSKDMKEYSDVLRSSFLEVVLQDNEKSIYLLRKLEPSDFSMEMPLLPTEKERDERRVLEDTDKFSLCKFKIAQIWLLVNKEKVSMKNEGVAWVMPDNIRQTLKNKFLRIRFINETAGDKSLLVFTDIDVTETWPQKILNQLPDRLDELKDANGVVLKDANGVVQTRSTLNYVKTYAKDNIYCNDQYDKKIVSVSDQMALIVKKDRNIDKQKAESYFKRLAKKDKNKDKNKDIRSSPLSEMYLQEFFAYIEKLISYKIMWVIDIENAGTTYRLDPGQEQSLIHK